jgi:putative acetyltransferase
MEHILSTGCLNGMTRFYSEVSLTARPFYERFGFNVVKEKQMELKEQKLTNFVVEKFS